MVAVDGAYLSPWLDGVVPLSQTPTRLLASGRADVEVKLVEEVGDGSGRVLYPVDSENLVVAPLEVGEYYVGAVCPAVLGADGRIARVFPPLALDEQAEPLLVGDLTVRDAERAAEAERIRNEFDEFVPAVNSELDRLRGETEQAVENASDALIRAGQTPVSWRTEYAGSASDTLAPEFGWGTERPTDAFTWMRTVVTYGNGDTAVGSPVLVTGPEGAPGVKGDKGDAGQGLILAGNVNTYSELPGEGGAVNFTKTDLVIQPDTRWDSPHLDLPAGEPVDVTITAKSDWYQEIQVMIVPGNVPLLQGDLSPDFQTFTGSGLTPNNALPKRIVIDYNTYQSNVPLEIKSLHVTAGEPTDPPGPGDAGKAWYNLEDGRLYIWDGAQFPPEGQGVQMEGPAAQEALALAQNLVATIEAGLMRYAKPENPPTPSKGLVWAVLNSTGTTVIGLKIPNSNATGWVPFQLLGEDVLVVGVDGTVRLRNGVVTANTLAATIALVSEIIAGSEDGTHAKLDQTGFHAYRPLVQGGVAEVVSLGVDGSTDYLAITDGNGDTLSSLDDVGGGSFRSVVADRVEASTDLIVSGSTLTDIIRSYVPKIVVARQFDNAVWGVTQVASSNVLTAVEVRYSNSSAEAVNLLFLPVVASVYCVGNFVLHAYWNYTLNGTTPGLAVKDSKVHNSIRTGSSGDASITTSTMRVEVPAGAELVARLFFHGNANSGAATFTPASAATTDVTVLDVGFAAEEEMGTAAAITSTVTTAPPAKKTYTKTWSSTSRFSTTNSFYAGKAVQGTWNGTTYRGAALFSTDILATLSGAEVLKVEAYVKLDHSYYNSGAVVRIGCHGYTTTPSSVGTGSGVLVTKTIAKGGGAWVTLPEIAKTQFKSGGYRGLLLLGTGLGEYAYATDLRIRITYRK